MVHMGYLEILQSEQDEYCLDSCTQESKLGFLSKPLVPGFPHLSNQKITQITQGLLRFSDQSS